MWVGGDRHAPAALPSGKTPYPLYRRLGGTQGRYGMVWKISPPPGFDPWTVQPVASRYTDWAMAALCSPANLNKMYSVSVTDAYYWADLLTISDYERSLSPCHITTATRGPEKQRFRSSTSPSRGSQVALWARRSSSQKFTREEHVTEDTADVTAVEAADKAVTISASANIHLAFVVTPRPSVQRHQLLQDAVCKNKDLAKS